jgi:hypothetical protein
LIGIIPYKNAPKEAIFNLASETEGCNWLLSWLYFLKFLGQN